MKRIFREIIDLHYFDQFKYREYIFVIVPRATFGLFILVEFLLLMNAIANIGNNIQETLPSMSPFAGCIATTLTYWHFWRQRDDFYLLFDAIQDIVNERMWRCSWLCSKHFSHPKNLVLWTGIGQRNTLYVQTQKRVQRLIKLFEAMFIPTAATLLPFVRVVYHLCVGKYSTDSWIFYFPIW